MVYVKVRDTIPTVLLFVLVSLKVRGSKVLATIIREAGATTKDTTTTITTLARTKATTTTTLEGEGSRGLKRQFHCW